MAKIIYIYFKEFFEKYEKLIKSILIEHKRTGIELYFYKEDNSWWTEVMHPILPETISVPVNPANTLFTNYAHRNYFSFNTGSILCEVLLSKKEIKDKFYKSFDLVLESNVFTIYINLESKKYYKKIVKEL